jgi:formylglycine-generating enzyme required for sulfatase activity
MTEKLQSILEAEGLSALLGKFNDQGVTDSILGDLNDSDLKELGVDKLGERKRLLAAFSKSGGGTASVSVVEEAAPQGGSTAASLKAAATPTEATKDSPWVNTLGMPFVPIPRFETRFCVWPVRVQDYEAYCIASGAKFPEIPFPQEADHPIVGVSWNDAIEFCVWLTGKERAEGKIDDKTLYRLPTDLEWSAAVGLPHEPEATPAERHLKAPGYPWGLRWPPPKNSGNYEHDRKDQFCFGQEEKIWAASAQWHSDRLEQLGSDPKFEKQYNRDFPCHSSSESEAKDIAAIYSNLQTEWGSKWTPVDEQEFTSSVGFFAPSAHAIHDLGGNVWEWCMDAWSPNQKNEKVLRGGSFAFGPRRPRIFKVHEVSYTDISGSLRRDFSVDVPSENSDLYRSSYRHLEQADKLSCVRVHSGLPPQNEKIDERGWRDFPNCGFRLVVVRS